MQNIRLNHRSPFKHNGITKLKSTKNNLSAQMASETIGIQAVLSQQVVEYLYNLLEPFLL